MENNDINKINEIIADSLNNINHLEQIIYTKLFNLETNEYIFCQIDYFNLVIFYHKKMKELKEVKDEKFSFEYIKIMILTLEKIKNKLEYILSNFISKNVQYEYEKSISALRTHEKYYEEQIGIFERLNNDLLKH